MSHGLSPGQAKVGNLTSHIVAQLLFGNTSTRAAFDIAVSDHKMPCRLMATERWTSGKCHAYATSGSRTCCECHHTPPLRKASDPLTVFMRREHPLIAKEQITMREGMSMVEIKECVKCGRQKKIIAKGMCNVCGYGKNKDKTRAEVMWKPGDPLIVEMLDIQDIPKIKATAAALRDRIARQPGGEPLKYEGSPADDIEQSANKAGLALTDPKKTYLSIDLRTTEDNDLYSRISERAARNRRDPGAELLALAEKALDNGADSEKVEISKIKKIVERMSTYPVPNGNPREVFAEAFKMMLIRLDELGE